MGKKKEDATTITQVRTMKEKKNTETATEKINRPASLVLDVQAEGKPTKHTALHE